MSKSRVIPIKKRWDEENIKPEVDGEIRVEGREIGDLRWDQKETRSLYGSCEGWVPHV